MVNQVENQVKVNVGITHGDINGIGYEVIIKSLQDQRICELFTPVLYGLAKAASYHRKTLSIQDFNFNIIKSADKVKLNKPNIINIHNSEVKIELGQPSKKAGEMAFISLEAAVQDLKKGLIDVLVTAPINKNSIQSMEFDFPGHTEYLARRFESNDFLMLMVSEQIRIGTVTGHIPLKDAAETISKDLIEKKISILNESLKCDFNIRKPKIAVLSLNPHASDEGLIGNEEEEIIIPVIESTSDKGMLVYGPFSADGFFGSATHKNYDGILAMYHDQAMLPFKLISFESGVNYTAGLPIVRTSPAHGTAFDITGKNKANPDSFRKALYLAVDIYNNRKMNRDLDENKMKESVPEENNNHLKE